MSDEYGTMKVPAHTGNPPGHLAASSAVSHQGGFFVSCQYCDRPSRYPDRRLCHSHATRKPGNRAGPIKVKKCNPPTPGCCYDTAHSRCKVLWGSATNYPCIKCGERSADWAYDGTDPTELVGDTNARGKHGVMMAYSAYPEFYMPMCKECHRVFDGVGVNNDW